MSLKRAFGTPGVTGRAKVRARRLRIRSRSNHKQWKLKNGTPLWFLLKGRIKKTFMKELFKGKHERIT